MGKGKAGSIIAIILLSILIIAIGIADWLIPQLPAVSLQEGIFEAAQILLVGVVGAVAIITGSRG